VIQKNRGIYFNAKVLNLDDSSIEKTVRNAYVLLVNCSVADFTITVLSMTTQTSIFHFKFKHSNPSESDIHTTLLTEVNPIYNISNIKLHILDAIKNLNSEHLQEQIESNHIRIQ